MNSVPVDPRRPMCSRVVHRAERRQLVTSLCDASTPNVVIEVLADRDGGVAAAQLLRSMGATCRVVDDPSGYVSAEVPKHRLGEVLSATVIRRARVDGSSWLQEPPEGTATRPIRIPHARVARVAADGDPTFDAESVRLSELRADHPDLDGRGGVIALVDDGVDWLHPALTWALDAAGNRVSKVIDLIPPCDRRDPFWVMCEPVMATSGMVEVHSRKWRLPDGGDYALGVLRFALWPSLNPGALPSPIVEAGVLWDRRTDEVRVEAGGDGDFTDDAPVRPYADSGQIGWVGSASDGRDDRIPFGVVLDRDRGAVYVGVPMFHGSLVAGSASASTRDGGLFDGVAPAAQLIDVRHQTALRLESIVLAMRDRRVDVVNRSGRLGGELAGGEEEFEREVTRRLIEVHDRPLAAYGTPPGSIFVLDYWTGASIQRNRQAPPPYRDGINSRVPFRCDGTVNVVLAPSTNPVVDCRFSPFVQWDEAGIRRRMTLADQPQPPAPDGYAVGANPSPTIPIVSAAITLLVQLARRHNVPYDAHRLTFAVTSSARLIDGFPASHQGFGLLDVAAAWQALRAAARADDTAEPDLVRIEPQVGFGFAEDDAPQAGGRAITVVRRGGHRGSRTYDLELRGDTDAFELHDRRIVADRDAPTVVRFGLRPGTGHFVAFLRFRDRESGALVAEVPLSIRRPHPFTGASGDLTLTGEIPARRSLRQYVRIPDGLDGIRVRIRKGDVGFTGVRKGGTSNHFTHINWWVFLQSDFSAVIPVTPGTATRALPEEGIEETTAHIAQPKPGVAEIYFDNRSVPEYETPYDPPAPHHAISFEVRIEQFAVRARIERGRLLIDNDGCTFRGRPVLFHGPVTTAELPPGELVTTKQLTVTEGTEEVRVHLNGEAVSAYLLDGTGDQAPTAAADADFVDGTATLSVRSPKPGVWLLAVLDATTPIEIRSVLLEQYGAELDWRTIDHNRTASWDVPTVPAEHRRYVAVEIESTPDIGPFRLPARPVDEEGPQWRA